MPVKKSVKTLSRKGLTNDCNSGEQILAFVIVNFEIVDRIDKTLTHDGGGVCCSEVVGGVQELVRVVHGVILLVSLHRRAHIRSRNFSKVWGKN